MMDDGNDGMNWKRVRNDRIPGHKRREEERKEGQKIRSRARKGIDASVFVRAV
jgi:hypothetical protein